jgi:hypothetical protein
MKLLDLQPWYGMLTSIPRERLYEVKSGIMAAGVVGPVMKASQNKYIAVSRFIQLKYIII